MSKLIKWPLFILIGLLIIVGIKAPLLFRLPTLINTTRAKMFCSCYFVVGARGRAASLKISNTSSGQSWRYGTVRADIQQDGRR